MRTGHYVSGQTTGRTPAAWVSVVVTPTIPAGVGETRAALPSTFGGVVACWTRRDHGQWSAVDSGRWEDPADWWAWLERWAHPRRRTWVVAPVASDALTYLRFWERVTRLGGRFERSSPAPAGEGGARRLFPGFTFRRLVLSGKPDIVEYTLHQRSYTWVSLAQYWPSGSSTHPTPTSPSSCSSPPPPTSASHCTSTPTERCAATLQTMRSLAGWWSGLHAGGFGRTIGSLALSYLKSRLTPKSICTHTDTRVQRLERLACHGGRASTWYYGDSRAPRTRRSPDLPPLPSDARWCMRETLYHVDVSSMYPWLMTAIDTPTSLISYDQSPTVKGLAGLVERYCVVANVMLDTPAAEYPHRRGERVVYPTGQFKSVLCGAELSRALRDGVVTAVTSAAIYHRGRPFAAPAGELLALRSQARSAGNPEWESFLKLLSNSSTGKLAQRSCVWVDRPDVWSEVEWGEWPHLDAETGAIVRRRAVAGMVQEQDRDRPSTGTMTACYAHITSAGRDHMRTVRESIPPRSVVSQDTDGLWVTRAGLDAIESAGMLSAPGPGRLRVVEESSYSRWYSPKHYFAAGRWTLAGMSAPLHIAGTLSFWDQWTSNLVRSTCPQPPDVVHLHTREVTLMCVPQDGTVGPDGWQIPFSLPARPKSSPSLHDDPTPDPHLILPDMS